MGGHLKLSGLDSSRDLGHHPHFSAPLSPHPLKMNKQGLIGSRLACHSLGYSKAMTTMKEVQELTGGWSFEAEWPR